MSEPDATGEAVAAPPKSKMVPVVLMINTLLLAGVLVFTLTKKSAPADPQGDEKKEEGHGAEAKAAEGHGEKGAGEHGAAKGPTPGQIGPTVRLENFVVQLKAVESERFAHLGVELEVGTDDDKAIITRYLPKIRDSVLQFLADRTADELRGSDGLARIKTEIFDRLQTVVPGRKIQAVFITDYIVQ